MFSPDGTLLAAVNMSLAGPGNTMTIWNVADGTEITTLHGDKDSFWDAAFNPNGELLASIGRHHIKLQNLDVDTLLVQGCESLRSYLHSHPSLSETDRFLCLDEEITVYQKQIETNPVHATAWNNIGLALYKQEKLNEALAAFQEQVRAKPDHKNAWHNMGRVLQAQGNPDEAIAAYQRQLEVKPDHQEAWTHLGLILQAQGNLDEAISIYQEYGERMQSQGKLNEAIATYQKLFEVKPGHEEAWNNIGVAFYRQHKRDEAIAAFQKQIEVKPNHEAAWENIKRIEAELKTESKFDEILVIFQKIVEVVPTHAKAWYSLGRALAINVREDEAFAAYRKAIEIKPDHPDGWNRIGGILYSQDKENEAISAFLRQLEVTPDHESALGSILFIKNELKMQGKLDEAEALYHKLFELKLDPENGWNRMGLALYRQGKVDEAITALRKQIEVNPDNKSAWGNLAAMLYKEGNVDEAAKVATEGLTVHPNQRFLLFADALFALAQNDSTRCQTRVAAALSQVTPKDNLFVILPFLDWLANPEQGWEPVMTAINELDPEVTFTGGEGIYSDVAPVVERLDAETQRVAQHFIEFFQGKIDLPTLKARLAEQE